MRWIFPTAICLLLLMALAVKAQVVVPEQEDILATLHAGHPRLLATAADFEKLRQRVATDPLLKKWHDQLRQQAEGIVRRQPVQMSVRTGTRSVLQGTGQLRNSMYTLGMLYQLDGDPKYVELAWRDMQSAIACDDWNPGHFLGAAETTRALAIGYDWMYQGLSQPQRDAITAAIVEKGITPALLAYRGMSPTGWWPAVKTNWNQVCNGGIGMGALAIADTHPQLASQTLWYVAKLLPLAMLTYAPDGAWNEGLAYWQYGGEFNVQCMASMHTALGTDFGLTDMQGYDRTGDYPIHMTGPTGLGFNFADSPRELRVHSPSMLWYASRFRQPRYARHYLPHARGNVLEMLWYDPSLLTEKADPPLPLDIHFRGCDVFTFRSAWDDPSATYIAFKAGDNQDNHAHADIGSFVLDALGHRWAVDLGSDSYELPGYFRWQRWQYYRVRTESHNTLVFNPSKGPGQNLKAAGKVVSFERQADGRSATATLDLTAVYSTQSPAPQKVMRTITREGVNVWIEDHITPAAANPTQALWLMHTPATVTLTDDGAMLTIDGKQLRVRIVSPAGLRFETAPAQPLVTSPNPPDQAKNEGVTRLSIRLDEALANGPIDLKVVFKPVVASTP